jgi:hypothetical protein
MKLRKISPIYLENCLEYFLENNNHNPSPYSDEQKPYGYTAAAA